MLISLHGLTKYIVLYGLFTFLLTAEGMRSWGFLISPAIGGFLADPLKQYPKSSLVHTFESFLSTYPFSLPNIFGSLLCLGSMFATIMYVEETLPADKLRSMRHVPQDIQKYLFQFSQPYCRSEKSSTHTQNELTYGTERNEVHAPNPIITFWSNRKTRALFIIYWINSFIVAGIDEVWKNNRRFSAQKTPVQRALKTNILSFILNFLPVIIHPFSRSSHFFVCQ